MSEKKHKKDEISKSKSKSKKNDADESKSKKKDVERKSKSKKKYVERKSKSNEIYEFGKGKVESFDKLVKENKASNRSWYHGLDGKWWWGMTEEDVRTRLVEVEQILGKIKKADIETKTDDIKDIKADIETKN